jgi:phosphoglycerate dehydrogenase-like enzyme
VLLSPHAAGSTVQAVTRILQQTNDNLRRVLDGEPVLDVLNGLPARVVRRGRP